MRFDVVKNILRLALLCGIFYAASSAMKVYLPGTPSQTSGIDKDAMGAAEAPGTEIVVQEATEGTDTGSSIDVPDSDAADSEGVPEDAELSRSLPLFSFAYEVKSGDMIGQLALDYGLNQDTLISVNKINNTRAIYPGNLIQVPNQDGILYTVKKGDNLASIAKKFDVDVSAIQTANSHFADKILVSSKVFIPGAQLDRDTLSEINGDLFRWPVYGYFYISSPYGYRRDPFGSGRREFHTGIDIPAPQGTPIHAAMAGRVSIVGHKGANGYYVVLIHTGGYKTEYCHMKQLSSKWPLYLHAGQYVKAGQIIGYVGSTGESTGPHCHFMVYKNGYTVSPLLYTVRK
jgi:LysM repeat protein